MRRIVQFTWAGLAALFIIPLVGGFVSEWAKELGWYERPSARVESAMNWILSLGADPMYRIVAAFVCGVAFGMALDWLLRRREQHGTGTTAEPIKREGEIDYAHGLALERVQPSLDLGNQQNTLETRLVLRNTSGGPVKFQIERFDVVMHGMIVRSTGIVATIPTDGYMTILPNRGYSKKQ